MNMECMELERRLAIGFNEHMSLAKRHNYIITGADLESIARSEPKFRFYRRETRDVIHWLSRSRDNSIIWFGEKGYPDFRPIKYRLPYMIFCTGKRPDWVNLCAAIVGTRHATYGGMQQAFRFGMEAAVNLIGVVSGFAEGIDQSAMRGSLEGEGRCIGILGCGHDVEYPGLTLGLRERIKDAGGCVLSRFAPQTPAYKGNFISRNIMIAAYSSFVVAVQAPENSGTLSTCDFATQQGKDIYIGSEGIGDRFVQAGTSALFHDGARMISSLTDGSVEGVEPGLMVIESEDGQGGKRYGDRIYRINEFIG